MIRLGDITRVLAGQAAPKMFSDAGKPFIRAGHLEELLSGTLLDSLPKVSDNVAKKEGLKNIPAGTILFAKSGMSATKNRIYVTSEESYVVSHLAAILPSSNFCTPYLARYLSWYNPARLILDTAYPSIRLEDINNLEIPLPPLPIQKKIAAILDEADAYRQKTKALIDKYDELTQSLFLDMFGDPVKNEKGWEKSLAENYIDLLTGYPFKSDGYSKKKDDIRLCGGLIILPWGIEWEKCNRWSKNECQGLDKYWLEEGDIVMAMDRPWINTGFKIRLIRKEDTPSLLVQRTARIRGKGMNTTFLFFMLNSPSFEHHAKPTETTVPHISPRDIRSFNIIVPPISLQNQFAERVQAIETQKAQAQASLEKAEELFNSLLQRAFKGELV